MSKLSAMNKNRMLKITKQ